MNKLKTVLSVSIISLVILIAYLIIATTKYQQLLHEGSTLADNQCLKINPIIIERKRAYINSLTALETNDITAYRQETDHYLAISKKYADEQTKWLDTEKAYIDRWDFQIFVPSRMKELAVTQFVSRVADVDSTKALIEAFKVKDLSQTLQNEQIKRSIEQTQIRNAADDKYSELQNKPAAFDLRTPFITVPVSKCSEENFDIPNIEEFLNPRTPGNFKTPIS